MNKDEIDRSLACDLICDMNDYRSSRTLFREPSRRPIAPLDAQDA